MAGFTLDDRYLRDAGTVYVTGVQALVRMLFDRVRLDRRAGARTSVFVSATRAPRWPGSTWSWPGARSSWPSTTWSTSPA